MEGGLLHTIWHDVLAGIGGLAWVLCALLALTFVIWLPYGIFKLIRLPLRRRECARLFLDLLETALASGQPLDRFFTDVAATGDPTLRAPFHLLASRIRSGLRFEVAVALTPGLLTVQMAEIIKAGVQMGDLGAVLPACRRLLRDGESHARGAINYLILLMAFSAPAVPILLLSVDHFVVPALQSLAREMLVSGRVRGLQTMHELIGFVLPAYVLLWLIVLGWSFGYLAGPDWKQTRPVWIRWLLDQLTWRLPWRRKRLERDFAGLLAVLLDAQVPERTALELAAQSTGSSRMMARAARAGQQLEQGVAFPAALRQVATARELDWRLAHAQHGRTPFIQALSGWLESLDATAFQQEQGAAHLFTTGLVLLNGLLVGSIAIAVFSFFIDLIQEAVLW